MYTMFENLFESFIGKIIWPRAIFFRIKNTQKKLVYLTILFNPQECVG